MKKSLVLAMAMAMGISASAFAANPFSDVPAGHWAYGSIAKLAAAGVVDGYGDGTYRGDRLMTRYEMAQIVARAMAKGANVDRLASEFADELDSLGVRVAKLEKKSDNVKITGQNWTYYSDNTANKKNAADEHGSSFMMRNRLWFTGAVNDNWNYVGMLQNYHSFSNDMTNNKGKFNSVTSEADEGTAFQRAYLEGRLGGAHIIAGRWNVTKADGNLYDHRADAIQASYGKKVKLTGYYGRPTQEDSAFDYDKVWGADVAAEMGALNLAAGYDRFTNSASTLENNGVWNVAATYNFGKASLGAMYLKSNLDADAKNSTNKGVVVTGTLMGAEAAKPGSWGLWAKYYNQGYGTVLAHTMNGSYSDNGFQGWGAGVSYTLAKNMIGGFEYYDLNRKGEDVTDKTLFTQLTVTF